MAPPSETLAIGIQLLVALAIVRRSYSVSQGVPFSAARVLVSPVLIVVLWAVTEVESIALTPWAVPYLISLDASVLGASAYAFTGVAERRTVAWRDPKAGWMYRTEFSLALLFLGAFLLRLIVTAVYFPAALQTGVSVAGFPPGPQQAAIAGVDALFSMSAGLLIGRSRAALRRVRAAQASAGNEAPEGKSVG